MSKDIKDALERLLAGNANDTDCLKLKEAFTTGELIVTSGGRAASIGGNVKSPLVTGDSNYVVSLNFEGSSELQGFIPELKRLLERTGISEDSILPITEQLKPTKTVKPLYYILAHFLDHYVQGINNHQNSRKNKTFLAEQAKQALKFSLICSEKVLLPAVSYVQSKVTRSILKEYDFAFQSGLIELLGDGMTWGDFCEVRLREYHLSSPEHNTYQQFSKSSILGSAFSSVEGSITGFIEFNWSQRWNESQDTFKVFRARDRLHLQAGFEEEVFRVIHDREENAFISRNIAKKIFSYSGELENLLLTDDICSIFFDYFLQIPQVVFLSQIPGFKLGEPRNFSKGVNFSTLVRLLSERSDVSISELWKVTWEEGLLRFGTIGKECLNDFLHCSRDS